MTDIVSTQTSEKCNCVFCPLLVGETKIHIKDFTVDFCKDICASSFPTSPTPIKIIFRGEPEATHGQSESLISLIAYFVKEKNICELNIPTYVDESVYSLDITRMSTTTFKATFTTHILTSKK
jgi:hypothetical protein